MTKRIISLLPSSTEALACFGGDALLVGRSHECDWPPEILDRPILTSQRVTATDSAEIDAQVRQSLEESGSLYRLDAQRLAALRPDVILTQDLCDVCSIDLDTVRGVARTLDPPPRVVSSNPHSLAQALEDVTTIGEAVGMPAEARAARARLQARVDAASETGARRAEAAGRRPAVAFLEWFDPLFVGGHWTPELVERAGGRHPLNAAGQRSIVVSPEALAASAPDAIVLCPCGFDRDAGRRELDRLTRIPGWAALPAVRNGRVALVDGSAMFNRPGPRLVDALEWLTAWLWNRPTPDGFPAERVL